MYSSSACKRTKSGRNEKLITKKWFERRIPLIIIKVTANNFDAYANNFCEKLFTYEYGITDSDSTQLIFLDSQSFFD